VIPKEDEVTVNNPSEKVAGYRVLSDEIIAMMNEAKAMEKQCGALWQDHTDRRLEVDPSLDMRCMSLAKTHLQDAFMWWNRAIAQPEDVFK
jgi:hypothetical protein